MLILTLKPDEAVVIGDDVKIYFERRGRNSVFTDIEAPDCVTILRGEIAKTRAAHGIKSQLTQKEKKNGDDKMQRVQK